MKKYSAKIAEVLKRRKNVSRNSWRKPCRSFES
jgi:hypothetical protein